MAGAGYKLFNTGDVLLASEVNTYLMQQTVMVFANATARTSALSGVLAEGMLSYLADTNATEVYDGSAWVSVSGTGDITAVTTGANSGLAGGVTTGNADIKINFASKGQLAVGTGSGTTDFLNVGTNGHTLVADSGETTGLKWAAPAAGGLTLLETLTLSGSSTTSATISGDYVNLLLVVKNVYGSAQSQLDVRFNGDTGNNYYTRRFRNVNGTVSAVTAAAASRFTDFITFDTSSTLTNRAYAVFRVFRYTDTDITYIETTATSLETDFRSMTGQMLYDNSAAITSVTFLTSAGTFSGGTVYIYGEK